MCSMFVSGNVVTCSYPSDNRVGARTRLEPRRIVVRRERDLSISPLDPIILQRLMRHRDIKTTLKFYVAQEADDVGDELQRAYRNNENVHQNVHQSGKKTKGRPKKDAKNAGKNGDFG